MASPGELMGLRGLAYAWGPARYYAPAYEQLAAYLAIDHGAALDVGCGSGELVRAVARGRPDLDVVGIDRDPSILGIARRRSHGLLNASWRAMDATAIRFPDATFDVAWAVQSAHHWEDPAAVLREVHRVLKPGATLHLFEAAHDAEAHHHWVAHWVPRFWVRRMWRRFHLDLAALPTAPFTRCEPDTVGFYQHLALEVTCRPDQAPRPP